jgi:GAF domain-containing protein
MESRLDVDIFSTIAANAASVCSADDVVIRLVDGEGLRLVGHFGPLDPSHSGTVIPISQPHGYGPAILDRQTVHVPDFSTSDECPSAQQTARRQGFHTGLITPLLQDGAAIGAISARRREIRPFSEREIAMLETFAQLAATTIQNARLLDVVEARNRELANALEHQTATAEVLSIIASSPTELQPVLDAIARIARQVSRAADVTIALVDGDQLRIAVRDGASLPAFSPGEIRPIDDTSVLARSILARATVQVEDGKAFPEGHPIRERSLALDLGTVMATPLLRQGVPIGAIGPARKEVRPFTEREIALFEAFAQQAVIAIENVRLFQEINDRNAELREALEQQTATSEVLRIISSSPSELQRVLGAICESAARVCRVSAATIRLIEGDNLRAVARYRADARVFDLDSIPLAKLRLKPTRDAGTDIRYLA